MVYYNDNYHIHYSEKDGSRWFPQKLYQRRLICIMSKRGRINNIKVRSDRD